MPGWGHYTSLRVMTPGVLLQMCTREHRREKRLHRTVPGSRTPPNIPSTFSVSCHFNRGVPHRCSTSTSLPTGGTMWPDDMAAEAIVYARDSRRAPRASEADYFLDLATHD